MVEQTTPAASGGQTKQTSRIARYVGLAIIFIAFSLAAVILGARVVIKHNQLTLSNEMGVSGRWGGAITQLPPVVTYLFEPERYDKDGNVVKAAVIQRKMPASDIAVDLALSYRQRGQMQFPGYEVAFEASYIVENPFDESLPVSFNFPIPQHSGLLKDFIITVDGEPYRGDQDFSDGVDWKKNLAQGDRHTINIAYTSRGMGDWSYGLSNYQGDISLFKLHLKSNFADIDYPEGSMVPTLMSVDETSDSAELAWEFSNLVSGQNIGVTIPRPLNVGKATSGILFFVPFALLFFLGLILLLTSVRGVSLHPMHFLFITGGFFVFHILMSYLVVLVPLVWAFVISLAASCLMTMGYAALIRKGWVVVFSTGLGILLFQLGFSLAQFFPNIRGLIIALIIIAGLGLAMGFTARVDWKGKL